MKAIIYAFIKLGDWTLCKQICFFLVLALRLSFGQPCFLGHLTSNNQEQSDNVIPLKTALKNSVESNPITDTRVKNKHKSLEQNFKQIQMRTDHRHQQTKRLQGAK